MATQNDNKTNTRADHISFDVDRSVDVYVAYTPSATGLPVWLSDFVNTGLAVGISAGTPTFNLYKKTYPAGTVVLGGNMASGAVNSGNSNYVVIVQPAQ